ncbi:uncharacterized protein LOC112054780 isoform X2 [Bicyclus anynana]|uniref:Uncharacterized protein LOC112054780 isoform X2 n=1 Tax=Bicyclus anynana TaxID=110368 RepID=A0ABM3LU58_BICAN|nr:uncharacterized protein LOC112054780 isoform X2 [Bicyclus anynana]
MKTLWICVAFIATYGNLAVADDSEEEGLLYYDDSYEYNLDSNQYQGGETNEDTDNKPLNDFINVFRTTLADKQYDIQDYQVEDNRLSEDMYAAEDGHLNSNKNVGKQTEKEVTTATKLDDSKLHIGNSVETGDDNLNYDEKIFNDTKAILDDENGNDFEKTTFVELNTEKTSSLTEILEETRRLLNETLDKMEEENENADDDPLSYSFFPLESYEDVSNENLNITEEDSVDQAIKDFKNDLQKLQETWDKLNDFDASIFEWNDQDKISTNNITSSEESEEFENVLSDEDKKEEIKSVNEVIPEDSQLKTEINASHPILYLDDALPASESETTHSKEDKTTPTLTTQEIILADVLNNIQPVNRNFLLTEKESNSTAELTQTTPNVDNLSSAEVETLMSDFDSKNQIAEITQSDIAAATNIWLTVDSPTVITSPGFPNPYPTNIVTDWMITGNGVGIELNVTDLAINGHVGDYLLFKPGGLDVSGSNGLIFSYTLRNERRYRFLDVDKMFVRFDARRGPQILRGFSFSVRMVSPRPGMPEPEPEPTPVIPDPPETITINLGGVSLEGFLQIEEEFRQIVAKMAATYIANNDIDPGINTTLETTQITSRALCFHNWPKFEQCAEVRFGVALVYEDNQDSESEEREPRLNAADLTNMWEMYSQRNPYAEILRSLGITEYQVPNDRGILTVWLVIAGGVVISMAMLAFALWRFNCFDNYTRMPAFSDTDSVKEKRNLDLYPTPHQTLPPLYSETDYKWADAKYDDSTKVDVGGYTNKSYMREDPYDLDSDEDIVPVSARYTTDV